MATDAYDSSFPESQSDKARARIDAEFDSLNGRAEAVTSATEELCDLAKALILRERSLPEETHGLAGRFKQLDTIDLIEELTNFVECAYLGVEAMGSPKARSALQAILNHVLYGLKLLPDRLDPDAAEMEAA